MTNQIENYTGGGKTKGASGLSSPVFDPSTGEQTEEMSLASSAEVANAIKVTMAALRRWASTTPLRRARISNRFLLILGERVHEMFALITLSGTRRRFIAWPQ